MPVRCVSAKIPRDRIRPPILTVEDKLNHLSDSASPPDAGRDQVCKAPGILGCICNRDRQTSSAQDRNIIDVVSDVTQLAIVESFFIEKPCDGVRFERNSLAQVTDAEFGGSSSNG